MDIAACMKIPDELKYLYGALQLCSQNFIGFQKEIQSKFVECQKKKNANCMIDIIRTIVDIADRHKVFDRLIEVNAKLTVLIQSVIQCLNLNYQI